MDSSTRKLLVGIGNPGEKYCYTRHNVGFLVVDAFVSYLQKEWERKLKLKSLLAKFLIEDIEVIVIKPLTFVNLSGEAVSAIMKYYGVNRSNILVISDDINLPLGSMRLKMKGSAGGHNGLKNIIEKLGSLDFSRLRIGIGKPNLMSLSEYVLAPFSIEEKKQLNLIIEKLMLFLTFWVKNSFKEAELMFSKLK